MAAPAPVPPAPREPVERVLERLRTLVDWELLARLGWDPDAQVLTPSLSHPQLGYHECVVEGCDLPAVRTERLCATCYNHWKASGRGDVPAFARAGRRWARRNGEELCLVCNVAGHERPAKVQGLCEACDNTRRARGQHVDAYVRGDDLYVPARPRPSFGRCLCSACTRWACDARRLCRTHLRYWQQAENPSGEALRHWADQQNPSQADANPAQIILRGLPERLRLELLFSVQRCVEEGRRIAPGSMRQLVTHLRKTDAVSVLDLDPDQAGGRYPRENLWFFTDRLRWLTGAVEEEIAADRWDLRLFGKEVGRLQFSQISQPWLKRAAKAWAAHTLPRIDSRDGDPVRKVLMAVRRLSEALRVTRDDRGDDISGVRREDLTLLLARLARLESRGDFSRATRRETIRCIEHFLTECRALGMEHPGEPLAGLPADFALVRGDRLRPESSDDEEPGRALPAAVEAALFGSEGLTVLEQRCGPAARAAMELLNATGRRPIEIRHLTCDCLHHNEESLDDGSVMRRPMLVYDQTKGRRVRNRRLPITDDAAAVIGAQVERARAAHPDTSVSDLRLFPTPRQNPRGTRPLSQGVIEDWLRRWIDALGELRDDGGNVVDRAGITPYSLRHTWAQRHADAGVAPDVLCDLMGHRNISTTQVYYRVRHRRRRDAVDLATAHMRFDAEGRRVRTTLDRLLDEEHTRRQVGQVAVPFGVCTEPSNVKAMGAACPYRHRCFGCSRFQTDPSYLPDLREYLTTLLADRERLRAVVPELAEWARREALPSDEEIDRVRALIRACQGAIAELPAEDRDAVLRALDEARTARQGARQALSLQVPNRVIQTLPVFVPPAANTSSGKEAADG